MENKIQKGPSLIFEFPAKIFLLPVSVLEDHYYIYSVQTRFLEPNSTALQSM